MFVLYNTAMIAMPGTTVAAKRISFFGIGRFIPFLRVRKIKIHQIANAGSTTNCAGVSEKV